MQKPRPNMDQKEKAVEKYKGMKVDQSQERN